MRLLLIANFSLIGVASFRSSQVVWSSRVYFACEGQVFSTVTEEDPLLSKSPMQEHGLPKKKSSSISELCKNLSPVLQGKSS